MTNDKELQEIMMGLKNHLHDFSLFYGKNCFSVKCYCVLTFSH